MNTGEVLPQKFTTDAQFSFHHINAYEQKESDECTNLIVDIGSFSCGKGQFSLHELTYKQINEGHLQNTDKSKCVARRITVPLSKNNKPGDEVHCQIDTLNPEPMEFPTINYGRNNQLPYKYFYCTNSLYSKPFTVMKFNVEDPKDTLKFTYNIEGGKNIVPSEPIFVENPNPQGEDDGVVLVQVLSDENDYLSVLDAKTMTEIARADLPKDVKSTFTFHGFFADEAQMLSMLQQ
jgi:carotenoid cleavage dioxygenase-like enzyme